MVSFGPPIWRTPHTSLLGWAGSLHRLHCLLPVCLYLNCTRLSCVPYIYICIQFIGGIYMGINLNKHEIHHYVCFSENRVLYHFNITAYFDRVSLFQIAIDWSQHPWFSDTPMWPATGGTHLKSWGYVEIWKSSNITLSYSWRLYETTNVHTCDLYIYIFNKHTPMYICVHT